MHTHFIWLISHRQSYKPARWCAFQSHATPTLSELVSAKDVALACHYVISADLFLLQ